MYVQHAYIYIYIYILCIHIYIYIYISNTAVPQLLKEANVRPRAVLTFESTYCVDKSTHIHICIT